jgi:hypothetical protein
MSNEPQRPPQPPKEPAAPPSMVRKNHREDNNTKKTPQ